MNAKQPITHDGRYIYDAEGRVVYRCSDIARVDGMAPDCSALWDAAFIDGNPAFECPTCGRLGSRMVEAKAPPGSSIKQQGDSQGEKSP